MDGGNGQKSKTALKRNEPTDVISTMLFISMQCNICKLTLICTTSDSEAKCKSHAQAKHPKSDLGQCLPPPQEIVLVAYAHSERSICSNPKARSRRNPLVLPHYVCKQLVTLCIMGLNFGLQQ
ncbi:hypothetical protein PR202_gb12005 [Eleusine coracana subsp. coracana]|uniref:At2g23090-like zinc-binding domain-containing protein n=1 Tax=Eleusine coracana subsp. coracana TaxID=191504 RepID=A0AAV5EN45_ELECO|nr:hypothetical protein PR202_gb12005 [Eleusine coracana subsp. coracana]